LNLGKQQLTLNIKDHGSYQQSTLAINYLAEATTLKFKNSELNKYIQQKTTQSQMWVLFYKFLPVKLLDSSEVV
jgi:hypothetical protein